MLQIVKLGGATLANASKINRMAKALVALRQKTNQIVVVVSAMGNTTDRLYKEFLEATGNHGKTQDLEGYLGLGELAAAKLLEGALRSLATPATVLSPYNTGWPLKIKVKTTASPLKQKQNEHKAFKLLPRSASRTRKEIQKFLNKKITPIITGFLAQDGAGRVVTLGRGGSDISAFLMAKILNADEIILVKDVKGVLAWDPSRIKTKNIPHIKVLDDHELFVLTRAGARVVHPNALKFLGSKTKARIVDSAASNWQDTGTEIQATRKVGLRVSSKPLAAITFIGNSLESTPGLLHALSKDLKKHDIAIHGVTLSDQFLAFYVFENQAPKAYALLVGASRAIPQLKSSTLKEGLRKITVRDWGFIENPGTIEKLVNPISKANINIWELITVHADISFLIEEKDVKEVWTLLSQALSLRKNALRRPRVA